MSRTPNPGEGWSAALPSSSVICAAPTLVIDDDPVALGAIVRVLEAARLAVTTARSGAEALVRAAVQRPELIISEAVLRGAPCGAMLRALRQLVPAAAIVVTTSVPVDDPHLVEALRRAHASYLPKPVAAERLLDRLRRGLLARS